MPFLPRRLLASWSMSSFCVAPSRVSRRRRMMNEARPSFAILYHGNVGIRFLSTLYGNQLCLVLHCSIPLAGPDRAAFPLGSPPYNTFTSCSRCFPAVRKSGFTEDATIR